MGLLVPLTSNYKAHDDSAPLNSLVNIHGLTNEGGFWTKSGGCGIALQCRGLDPECLDPERIDAITAHLDEAAKACDPNTTLRQYLIKRLGPELGSERCENPVVDRAIQNRVRWHRSKPLFFFENFLVIERKPEGASPRLTERLVHFARHPKKVLREALSVRERLVVLDDAFERSRKKLQRTTENLLERSADVLKARVLKPEDAFLFFRKLLNPDPELAKAILLGRPVDVDFQVVSSELEAHRDYLRLGGYYVKPLTLKQLPRQTFGWMLRDLYRVNAEFIAVSEWSPCDLVKAISAIRMGRRHFHNTSRHPAALLRHRSDGFDGDLIDTSKQALVHELGLLQQDIDLKGALVGNFTLTVLALGRTLEEVQRASAEITKVFGAREASMIEETYNGLNAFAATLPGGYPFNLRSLLATNWTYSDHSLLFLPSEGERRDSFTGAEHLIALESDFGSLYHVTPHAGDVGHAIMLGRTGSGKSFLLCTLIAHGQKYRPRSFVFTLGGDYQGLTKLLGGSYLQIRPDRLPFQISPFVLAPTPANLEFLIAFVKLLMESGGFRMSDTDERDTFDSIRSLYVLASELRTLDTLCKTLPRHLSNHLKRWTRGEQYPLFDNPTDTVTFSTFQCVDFEGMERAGVVLEALLFYLLHRANDIILDDALATTWKVFIVDEAWRFFKHAATRAYIIQALKTWRKKNAAMILATQSIEDLDLEVLRPVADACPTKFLLANPNIDAALYTDLLGLSPREQEKVKRLVPKKQFLFKRDDLAKVLTLNVDPESYWLFTTNPFEAKRRQDLVNEVGLEAALSILAGGNK